tara:strand:+ start:733 stop:1269 length:537 start_codon:yes stop_codon:yes gene_type:complete
MKYYEVIVNNEIKFILPWEEKEPPTVELNEFSRNIVSSSSAKKRRKREKDKYNKDATFRINDCVKSRFRQLVTKIRKNKSVDRNALFHSDLPYTNGDLIQHLENQFEEGMSWENNTAVGWHLDHIRPKASYSFTNTQDDMFLECWGLDNLRPLWADQNMGRETYIIDSDKRSWRWSNE